MADFAARLPVHGTSHALLGRDALVALTPRSSQNTGHACGGWSVPPPRWVRRWRSCSVACSTSELTEFSFRKQVGSCVTNFYRSVG